MVIPAPTACVRSATRNTFRDNREGGDPAPQERKVGRWERGDLYKERGGGASLWVSFEENTGTKEPKFGKACWN